MDSTEYEDPIPRIAGKQVAQALVDRDLALRVLEVFAIRVRRGDELPREYLEYLADAFDKIVHEKVRADHALHLARAKHHPSNAEIRLRNWLLADEVKKKLAAGMTPEDAYWAVADEWERHRITFDIVRHAYREAGTK